MSRLTVFLARSIGLFTVLLIAAFLVRGSTAIETTVANGPVMLAYAIISLALGIAMVVGHNVWSGGVLPVVITLLGWLILAKALLLLLVSPQSLSRLLGQMGYSEHYALYLAPALILGLYLAWAGFTAAAARKP